MNKDDIYYMKVALSEAKKAYVENEVPVGCVIVYNDKIIAKTHNKKVNTQCCIDHAEMIAIKKASKKLNVWVLQDCKMYVTLEPCLMCMGAIIQSRLKTLVFGAYEPKFGGCGSLCDLSRLSGLNHKVDVVPGVLEEESSNLLKAFFQDLRNKKKVD